MILNDSELKSKRFDYSQLNGFRENALSQYQVEHFEQLAQNARVDILEMCALANSGHPGGAMSSIEIFLLLWGCCDITPDSVADADHIIVSHGHTSAGVYAALIELGLFERDTVLNGFRRAGSEFEGHLNHKLPCIEWSSGNLGQGLSVGCGIAIAEREFKHKNSHVFVVMGDGEQQKGQIAEAMRLAVKYHLSNLIAVVDCNNMQATNDVSQVMPQDIAAEYRVCGWNVVETDGHDIANLYSVLRGAYCNTGSQPTVILAHTIMGKGVSFMEGRYKYHGLPVTGADLQAALIEQKCNQKTVKRFTCHHSRQGAKHDIELSVNPGRRIIYSADKPVDARSAFGHALMGLAETNMPQIPIAVIDCDLSPSLKTAEFAQNYQDKFIQIGISENMATSVAGGISKCDVLTFFAEFGVFGFYEAYNQLRQNDINQTSVKYIFTHCGLDVGEDGKTHQCLDYIGIADTLFNTKLLIPADANQTDCMVRYAATTPGNIIVAMGRSTVPIITASDGQAFFCENYQFEYGRGDWLRTGDDATIVTCGTFASKATLASDMLREQNMTIGVLNLPTPLQPDMQAIENAVATGVVVTYEDHNVNTGLGSIIAKIIAKKSWPIKLITMGVSEYGGSGKPEKLFEMQGLDVQSLIRTLKENIQKN